MLSRILSRMASAKSGLVMFFTIYKIVLEFITNNNVTDLAIKGPFRNNETNTCKREKILA